MSNLTSVSLGQNGAVLDGGLGIGNAPVNPTLPATQGTPAARVQIRAANASSYRVSEDGTVTGLGATSVQMGHVNTGAEGLLGTAKRFGSPIAPHDIRGSDLIEVPGLGQVTVAVAQRVGLLSSNRESGRPQNATQDSLDEATGVAEATRAAEAQAAQAVEDAQVAKANVLPGEHAESATKLIADHVSPGTATKALLDLADRGQISDVTLNAAASQAGVEPDQLAAAFAVSQMGFRQQFESYAVDRGVDPSDFSVWARQNAETEAKAAMISHVQNRRVDSYDGLIRRYMGDLDLRNPNAILNAKLGDGMKARQGANGRVVLTIPGHGEMGWAQALRLDLIGPHRRG
jgi:hypothetical protein